MVEKTKNRRKKQASEKKFALCVAQCNVFIYWFGHFVFRSDGIYRNQHRYTCWYIFILMPITRHWLKSTKCLITMSNCTANDSPPISQKSRLRSFTAFTVFTKTKTTWKHITVGWPIRVYVMLLNGFNVYKISLCSHYQTLVHLSLSVCDCMLCVYLIVYAYLQKYFKKREWVREREMHARIHNIPHSEVPLKTIQNNTTPHSNWRTSYHKEAHIVSHNPI